MQGDPLGVEPAISWKLVTCQRRKSEKKAPNFDGSTPDPSIRSCYTVSGSVPLWCGRTGGCTLTMTTAVDNRLSTILSYRAPFASRACGVKLDSKRKRSPGMRSWLIPTNYFSALLLYSAFARCEDLYTLMVKKITCNL